MITKNIPAAGEPYFYDVSLTIFENIEEVTIEQGQEQIVLKNKAQALELAKTIIETFGAKND
ncbi:hypothetical protein MYO4S_00274 [Serratia phage 4S]|nr:hypothetical protein MYO4S_00274 [Serratia phage 4S]